MSDVFGDEWRPDRSGILVQYASDELPEGYSGTTVKFRVRDPGKILWLPLADVIAQLVHANVPTYLQLNVKGFLGQKLFLNGNEGFRRAVSTRDAAPVIAYLTQAMQRLVARVEAEKKAQE